MMNSSFPIQVVKNLEEYRIVPVKMKGTEQLFELQIHGRRLHVRFSNREIREANTISFYQSETGLFWWEYGHYSKDNMEYIEKTSDFSTDLKRIFNLFLPGPQCFIYLSENKIACFRLCETLLLMRESSTRNKNFEKALQKVLFILEKNLREIERDHYHKWFSRLKLSEYIKREFFYLPDFSAMPKPSAKITQVTEYDEAQWKIELESSENRKATLILRNRHGNQSEPLLLTDDYYKNRKWSILHDEGEPDIVRPLPDDDYEVLEIF